MKRLSGVIPPEKFSLEPETLHCYGFDASGIESKPSAVVWPENVDDVIKISKFSYDNNIPVCPRGAGTGMTGGAIPLEGAVIVSFERMNKIIEVDPENLTVLVEPGVINGNLQRELEKVNLFYPPDPASLDFCTIGGNAAENAGGPRAVKYGVTRDYVLEIEGVLPDGRVLHTGVRTAKGVVGYDLTRLLVGSEGTLCTMTKIRLKLLPLPEDVVTLLAVFHDLGDCGTAVSKIIASGIIPRTLELMDGETLKAIENYKPLGLAHEAESLLLIELDGHPKAIAEDAERIADICDNLNADIRKAQSAAERESLWEARRAVSPALFHVSPTKIGEDIVVPRNKIPDMLISLRALSEKTGIKIVTFGHAGDGNLHVNIMIDVRDAQRMNRAKEVVKEIFRITLGMGGTISGEHGIGITKADYIGMEIKQPALDLMKGIKRLFDPKNILNPGKIFP